MTTLQITPLMLACQKNNAEEVKLLLSQGSKPDEKDSTDRTALFYCVENTDTSCISQLIRLKVNLNNQDKDGYTSLHLAVIGGNLVIVEYLIKNGADVNLTDSELHSVVHWAVVCGRDKVLELLLKNNADPETADIHGAYPIHYAAQMCGQIDVWDETINRDSSKSLAILKKLIDQKVKIDVEDFDQRNAIIWAASSGSSDALVELYEAGSDANKHEKDGLTALHCASSRGHMDCVRSLIELCKVSVDIMDNNNCTPIFYAATLGQVEICELLIKYGANLHVQDCRGRTVYHCSAAKGQLDCLKTICKKNPNIWLRNRRGDYPIQEAYFNKQYECVYYLLDAISDKKAARSSNMYDGRTILHIAAGENDLKLCKRLVACGADVNSLMRTSTNTYLTPYDVAKLKNANECAKYLKSCGGEVGGEIADKAANRIQKNLKKIKGGENSNLNKTNSLNQESSEQIDSSTNKSKSKEKKDKDLAKTNNNNNTANKSDETKKSSIKKNSNTDTSKIENSEKQQSSNKPIIKPIVGLDKQETIENETEPETNLVRQFQDRSAQTILCSTKQKIIMINPSNTDATTSDADGDADAGDTKKPSRQHQTNAEKARVVSNKEKSQKPKRSRTEGDINGTKSKKSDRNTMNHTNNANSNLNVSKSSNSDSESNKKENMPTRRMIESQQNHQQQKPARNKNSKNELPPPPPPQPTTKKERFPQEISSKNPTRIKKMPKNPTATTTTTTENQVKLIEPAIDSTNTRSDNEDFSDKTAYTNDDKEAEIDEDLTEEPIEEPSEEVNNNNNNDTSAETNDDTNEKPAKIKNSNPSKNSSNSKQIKTSKKAAGAIAAAVESNKSSLKQPKQKLIKKTRYVSEEIVSDDPDVLDDEYKNNKTSKNYNNNKSEPDDFEDVEEVDDDDYEGASASKTKSTKNNKNETKLSRVKHRERDEEELSDASSPERNDNLLKKNKKPTRKTDFKPFKSKVKTKPYPVVQVNQPVEDDNTVRLIFKTDEIKDTIVARKKYASLFDQQRLLLKSLYEIRRCRINNRDIIISPDLNNLLLKSYNFDIKKNCKSLKDLERMLEVLALEISEEYKKHNKRSQPAAKAQNQTPRSLNLIRSSSENSRPNNNSKSKEDVSKTAYNDHHNEAFKIRNDRNEQNLQLRIAYKPLLPNDIYKQYYNSNTKITFHKEQSPREKTLILPIIAQKSSFTI